MNKYSNKPNNITGIKIYKIILIIFFTTAGFLTSILSTKPELSETLIIESTVKCTYEDQSLEKIINLKENKCRYGLEISVGGEASKTIAEFYKNLRNRFVKIINA